MASALIGKLTCKLKGHHVYNSDCSIGNKFVCQPEPDNRHSKNRNAIIVIKSELKEKAKDNIIGHVPYALAQVIVHS